MPYKVIVKGHIEKETAVQYTLRQPPQLVKFIDEHVDFSGGSRNTAIIGLAFLGMKAAEKQLERGDQIISFGDK